MSNGPENREVRSGATRPIRYNLALSLLPHLICLSILLGSVAHGQLGTTPASAAADSVGQDKLAEVVNEVKSGNWASVDEIVTEAGPVRAVPILHDLFRNSQDTQVKEWIASELIKLGDKDGAYFDFMLVLANDAVGNSPPFPFRLEPETTPGAKPRQLDRQDPDGLRKEVTPEFLEWAKSRGIPLNLAAQEAMQTIPGRLLLLGGTGDRRAIPVLRRGLSSPNIMLDAMAAQGLAELKDKDSIPLIIDAYERAPVVAMALRSFDDPRAQSVWQSYLTKLLDAQKEQGAAQDKNLDADKPK